MTFVVVFPVTVTLIVIEDDKNSARYNCNTAMAEILVQLSPINTPRSIKLQRDAFSVT